LFEVLVTAIFFSFFCLSYNFHSLWSSSVFYQQQQVLPTTTKKFKKLKFQFSKRIVSFNSHFFHTQNTFVVKGIHTQNTFKKMLSFLHPYVAVIIDFIESIDDFMEKNGGEFNAYVLSIMLIVIGYAKFIQKAKKAKGLNQKTQGKLELFAGVNLLLPSKMQTEIGCAIVFFVLGQQIFTKTKEAKAEVLMSFFAKQIFRETWMRNNNRTSLTFLPNNVNEYGPVNVMYFAIFIGMISGAYLLAKAPATQDSGAEKLAEEIMKEVEKRQESKKTK